MRATVLLIAGLAACTPATVTPSLVDTRWGQIQGLMAGVTVAHAVQPLAAAAGELPWKDKYYISIGGAALYGVTFVGLLERQKWALWVALIGPAVGLTSVLGGWALHEAGAIDASISPDTFQIVGGVLQVGAWLIAYQLLRIDPRFSATVDVTPAATTLRVGWSWSF